MLENCEKDILEFLINKELIEIEVDLAITSSRIAFMKKGLLNNILEKVRKM